MENFGGFFCFYTLSAMSNFGGQSWNISLGPHVLACLIALGCLQAPVVFAWMKSCNLLFLIVGVVSWEWMVVLCLSFWVNYPTDHRQDSKGVEFLCPGVNPGYQPNCAKILLLLGLCRWHRSRGHWCRRVGAAEGDGADGVSVADGDSAEGISADGARVEGVSANGNRAEGVSADSDSVERDGTDSIEADVEGTGAEGVSADGVDIIGESLSTGLSLGDSLGDSLEALLLVVPSK